VRRAVWLSGWLLALHGSACYLPYRAPSASEPHALLKLRRVHHYSGPSWRWGETRTDQALIDDELWLATDDSPSQRAPQTRTVRVRPGRHALNVSTRLWHSEELRELKTVEVNKRYPATETVYKDGKHETRTVTKTERVTEQRWETSTVDITDASCSGTVEIQFQATGVYLMQYTFTGDGQCSLVCLEQTRSAAGVEPRLRPCATLAPEPPPELLAQP